MLKPKESDQPQSSVLIVDQSSESREVLRTVFQRRGVNIYEASGALQGLDLLRQHRPNVVVLDLDADAADDEAVRDEYASQSRKENSSLVVLGMTRRSADTLSGGRMIPKPYHYGPLIRTIEQLLKR